MHIPAAILTRRGRLAAIAAAGASLALPLSAQAATITVPDFASQSKTASASSFPISEWSWGLENHPGPGSATGGGGGRASFDNFEFKKRVDGASPLFMKAVATGQVLDGVIVDVTTPAGEKSGPGLRLCLSTVRVAKDNLAGDEGGAPTEDVELQVGGAVERYVGRDDTGAPIKITTGWDQVANTPLNASC